MSNAIDERRFPLSMLLSAASMVAVAIVAATTAQLTGLGATHIDASPPTKVRDLLFTELSGGAIGVADPVTKQQIEVIPAGKDGFIGVVVHGFARERFIAGRRADAPLRLVLATSGRARIEDPETGKIVSVGAFGPDNARAFNRFFDDVR